MLSDVNKIKDYDIINIEKNFYVDTKTCNHNNRVSIRVDSVLFDLFTNVHKILTNVYGSITKYKLIKYFVKVGLSKIIYYDIGIDNYKYVYCSGVYGRYVYSDLDYMMSGNWERYKISKKVTSTNMCNDEFVDSNVDLISSMIGNKVNIINASLYKVIAEYIYKGSIMVDKNIKNIMVISMDKYLSDLMFVFNEKVDSLRKNKNLKESD